MSGDQQRGNLGRLTTASEEIGILTRGFEVGTVTQGVSGEMVSYINVKILTPLRPKFWKGNTF